MVTPDGAAVLLLLDPDWVAAEKLVASDVGVVAAVAPEAQILGAALFCVTIATDMIFLLLTLCSEWISDQRRKRRAAFNPVDRPTFS